MTLLQKSKGLVFSWHWWWHDLHHLNWEDVLVERGRFSGCNVLLEPLAYDGIDDALLELYEIDAKCLIYRIQQTEQSPLLNIEKVEKDVNEAGRDEESEQE